MKAGILSVILAATISVWVSPEGRSQASSPTYPVTFGKAYKFQEITEGVYYATATGSIVTGSNNSVVIGQRDVLVVDTGTTPAAARAFLEDLKLVTNKPVRYVVNTHFHYDHTDGNQVYAGKSDIIGHEYVRYAILNLNVLNREPFKTSQLTNVPIRINALKRQIAEAKDDKQKTDLEKQLTATEQGWEQLKEIKPTPPNITYSKKKVLNLGGREVQLLFLGRGHTNGDTVIFLPKEKLVCTGDLMESQIAYMGDGQFDEWITTLDALKKLDFNTVLPGHGVPFTNKSLITAFQSYLADLIKQVATLRTQGLTADDTAQKVDMTSHKADFPQIQGLGAENSKLARRDDGNSPFWLRAIFVDAATGKVTTTRNWPSASRDAQIVTTSAGKIVTKTGDELTLYDKDLQRVSATKLPLPPSSPTDWYEWNAIPSPTGKTILIDVSHLKGKQRFNTWKWIQTDTLEVVQSWEAQPISYLAITDDQIAMIECGEYCNKLQVRGLSSEWRSIGPYMIMANSRLSFVDEDTIYVPQNIWFVGNPFGGNPRDASTPARLVRMNGQGIFVGKQPQENFPEENPLVAWEGKRFVVPGLHIEGSHPSLDIDGHRILKTFTVYDLSAPTQPHVLNVDGPTIKDFTWYALSPDGSRLAVLNDQRLELFNLPKW